MRGVLMTLFRAVRTLAIAIRPVAPAAADKLLDQMGVAGDARDLAALADEDWFAKLADSGCALAPPIPIFPRLALPEADRDGGPYCSSVRTLTSIKRGSPSSRTRW